MNAASCLEEPGSCDGDFGEEVADDENDIINVINLGESLLPEHFLRVDRSSTVQSSSTKSTSQPLQQLLALSTQLFSSRVQPLHENRQQQSSIKFSGDSSWIPSISSSSVPTTPGGAASIVALEEDSSGGGAPPVADSAAFEARPSSDSTLPSRSWESNPDTNRQQSSSASRNQTTTTSNPLQLAEKDNNTMKLHEVLQERIIRCKGPSEQEVSARVFLSGAQSVGTALCANALIYRGKLQVRRRRVKTR